MSASRVDRQNIKDSKTPNETIGSEETEEQMKKKKKKKKRLISRRSPSSAIGQHGSRSAHNYRTE